MGKVRHIDFYPDEWLAGTATLSAVEIGVYISACALIYSHGGPIEKDELRRFVKCHGIAYENAVSRLKMLGKLIENGSQIRVKRCEIELKKARNRSKKAKENGDKGGRPRKEINDLEKPDGSGSENLTTNLPTTNHQPPTMSPDAIASGGARGGATDPTPKPPRDQKNGRRKPKRPFPADWLPDERGIAFALDEGLDHAWIEREGSRCRDHHIAKGSEFADLDAAWRTWVRNADDFAPRNHRPNGFAGGSTPKPGEILSAAHAVKNRLRMGNE